MDKNIIKKILVIISVVLVALSVSGNIVSSANGRVTLLDFESFYFYIVVICALLYNLFNNRKTTLLTIAVLLTYILTGYLVYMMFQRITQIQMTLGLSFYVYFISAVFIFISLFFNDRELKHDNLNEFIGDESVKFSENNFIFVTYVSGIKDFPFNIPVLLVNNEPNSTIDIIYNIEGEHTANTMALPITNLKEINYTSELRVSPQEKNPEENTTKSMLLSSVIFGGHPLTQFLGVQGFNSFFDSISENYNKVNLNAYFQINLEVLIDNEVQKIMFFANKDPKEFIDLIKKNRNIEIYFFFCYNLITRW